MAKYSVGSTEVIKDDGTLDWSKVSAKPAGLVTGINGTSRFSSNFNAEPITSAWVENDGTGAVRIAYRRQTPVSNCNCNCDCGCFAKGSAVLMADGSLKAIEDVLVGDVVQGLTQPNTVVKARVMVLGTYALMTFEDQSLFWSSAHPLWVRRLAQQFWWVSRPDHWRISMERYKREGVHIGLTDPSSIWTSEGVPELFAHTEGWRQRTPVAEIPAGVAPEMLVYNLKTDGDRVHFVNGYAVAAGMNDREVDYASIHWRGLAVLAEQPTVVVPKARLQHDEAAA